MTQHQYSKQVNIVIDYILFNLEKPLLVDELSKLTTLSTFHFHRIFTHEVGESIAKFILRKRLELAAIILVDNLSITVTNISYEVGFSSVNVFCRNFKKHFGITAEAYRKINTQQDSKNSQLMRKKNTLDRSYFHYFCSEKSFINIKGDKKMECKFEIKELPELHVVYYRHYGAYDLMQEAYGKLMQWVLPRGLMMPESKLLSVFHDNPEVTKVESLISDACLIVDTLVKTDGAINARTIAGGTFAVGRFEIAIEEFPQAWQCVFQLLAEHGCQIAGVGYEIYHNNRDEHPERKWIVDICIPVMPK